MNTGKRCGASWGYFPTVKYKYTSSVSASSAPLQVLKASVVLTAPKERLSVICMLCWRSFHHRAQKKEASEMFTNSAPVAAATGSDERSGLEVG